MPPSNPHAGARFLPGAMIAGRFRVVALLGRGGMGEVYRADDTKLGEAVALKFLPERIENDTALRERFLGEARLARQVAHPNVCRVYDVGEVAGRLFLSMEYVDGEDLATLLRRIGRLPEDKAVQIAHELCSGLHAAHAQGIVHRDLKPSNVMLDGRGRARITDFGLAALASAVDPADVGAGTPAYMAPEQLLGQEVTVRSDVYALGLVLHELFTGRPAFESAGVADSLRRRREATPDTLSRTLGGLDPAVERVIVRCLRPDPLQRPSSAAAVALALPGGDPLAAALAAGETPSPEMIAEAGDEAGFRPAHAWGWLAAVLVALAATFALAPRCYLIQQVPIEKPPAVLVDRARDIARTLGWSEPPRDESTTMLYDSQHGEAVGKRFGPAAVVEHLRRYPAGTFTLLYRRSPGPIEPVDPFALYPTQLDPPLAIPGMLSIRVDGSGRLHSLDACPPDRDTAAAGGTAVDWAAVFALAGLDTADFRRVPPEWTPRTYADERLAWLGRVPGDSALSLRIEAASYRGRPIAFRRVQDWTRPIQPAAASGWIEWLVRILFLVLLVLAGVTARRNLHAGRADASGALRLGLAGALLLLARQWAGAELVADPQWLFVRILRSIGGSLLFFLATSILYLTLEPVMRRTWPRALVSWMRLLDGRWRDRRLGRDVLAGLAAGTVLQLLSIGIVQGWTTLTRQPLPSALVDAPGVQTDAVMGVGAAVSVILTTVSGALESGLAGVAVLALLTVVLRRNLPALLAAGVFMMLLNGAVGLSAVALVLMVVSYAMLLLLFVRFGFVSMLVGVMTVSVLEAIPLVTPGASWYWPATAVGLTGLLGLAALATRAMLRGGSPESPAARSPGRTPTSARAGGRAVAPAAASRADLSQAPTEISPRPDEPPRAAPRPAPRDDA
jgi:serine/threonine-protein kinase